MVFERILKGRYPGGRILPEEISITKTSITFGKDVVKDFNKGYVEILVDRKKGLVGFISSSNQITGYKIQDGQRTIASGFTKMMEKKVYKANKEKGIWVIKVKNIPKDLQTVKL